MHRHIYKEDNDTHKMMLLMMVVVATEFYRNRLSKEGLCLAKQRWGMYLKPFLLLELIAHLSIHELMDFLL